MSVKKRHGLGKGLNALLKSNDETVVKSVEKAEKSGVLEVDMSLIDVNPDQPRKVFNESDIEGLAETIEKHGLINPITLREKNGRYQIISGERRFRALKHLNREKAQAIVLTIDDNKMLELTLIENIQREDLNALEIARSYKKLIEDLDIKQEELALRVGKSRSTITNSMRLLDLSSNIQSLIAEGKISEGHARTILSLSSSKERERLAADIIEKGYSVRECEKIVKGIKEAKKEGISENIGDNNKAVKKDPNIRKVESDLEKIFATKVNVYDKNGKEGKITIEYYSSDDFERIMDILDTLQEKGSKSSISKTKIEY